MLFAFQTSGVVPEGRYSWFVIMEKQHFFVGFRVVEKRQVCLGFEVIVAELQVQETGDTFHIEHYPQTELQVLQRAPTLKTKP